MTAGQGNGPLVPPRPAHRGGQVGFFGRLRLFRRDILSSHPERFYRAWMAEYRGTLLRAVVCNDPDLVDVVLRERPADFPKSPRLARALEPLFGRSVFVANGAEWERRRRIVDPAFDGGRLRDSLPAMLGAAAAAVTRLAAQADGRAVEIEAETSHAAADAILRVLLSRPIATGEAAALFAAFRAHQRGQPLVNLGSALGLPGWLPGFHGRTVRQSAARLRALAAGLVAARRAALAAGTAPDDVTTRLMVARDPDTGRGLAPEEVVDEVVTLLLAGHETGAAALAWALWLLAASPAWQDRVAAEAAALPQRPGLADIAALATTRAVFREALRLYPPVPLILREATRPEVFRGRSLAAGTQVVISPWYLQRHDRIWTAAQVFDPSRFGTADGQACLRRAYLPFSAGPRVCPGAGFALLEGSVMLACLLRSYRLEPVAGRDPVPVAQITLRARDGIWLRLWPRGTGQRPR